MPTVVIKVKRKELPAPKNPDKDFEWLCRSLGLISPRDRQMTTAKVFKAIVLATKRYGGISIPELVEILGLSRTAVVHHLGEIWRTGLLVKDGMRFKLRRYNMKATVEEIEKDLRRIFERIKKIAEDVDEELGLPSR
jgi:biotin operon repressor